MRSLSFLTVGELFLRNRIVMAPMTRARWMALYLTRVWRTTMLRLPTSRFEAHEGSLA